jgi:hypothetical protein
MMDDRQLAFIKWLLNNTDLIDIVIGAAFNQLTMDDMPELYQDEQDTVFALRGFLPPINYAIREPKADDLLRD